ncbi:hypothetical protein B0H17DRAFT_1330789 [Mycena rosella]|uniref:Uncharacterized protein n=1 Tax=Mycena rosella TaxID=1033263 RepID=A0AAD7GFI2_MYCRO|nr:hypothetical protein B0H17DRAFT_1330789 [Mycena rosella]
MSKREFEFVEPIIAAPQTWQTVPRKFKMRYEEPCARCGTLYPRTSLTDGSSTCKGCSGKPITPALKPADPSVSPALQVPSSAHEVRYGYQAGGGADIIAIECECQPEKNSPAMPTPHLQFNQQAQSLKDAVQARITAIDCEAAATPTCTDDILRRHATALVQALNAADDFFQRN